MSMWETLETGENTTLATEVPGIGCIVAVPGVGMCFVPRTRLKMLSAPIDGATHVIQRDERAAPPLQTGKTAAQIRAAQPRDGADPAAAAYIIHDDDNADF